MSREFFMRDGEQYMREEWDLTVADCPWWIVDNTKWLTGESVRDPRAVRLTRTIKLPNCAVAA